MSVLGACLLHIAVVLGTMLATTVAVFYAGLGIRLLRNEGGVVPLTDHVALVSLTSDVPNRSLLQGAAAIQKQVTRDFTPAWGLAATVDAFEDLASVPGDYHPVIVFGEPDELVDQLELQRAIGAQSAARLIDLFASEQLVGLHLNTFTKQPFAVVAAQELWTVVASHEILEILADPSGNRLKAAAHPIDTEQRVRYLIEVCDPCQGTYYTVNGVPVADFYTPSYFDPVRLNGIRYSYTGELERPLQVLDGGYLTWIDPTDSGLYQLQGPESEPILLVELTDVVQSGRPLRTIVDTNRRTPNVNEASLTPARSAPAASDSPEAVLVASERTALRTMEAVWSVAAGEG